ncbi:MAG: c-type cytochrome [Candidatus Aminicenantales bacterium]
MPVLRRSALLCHRPIRFAAVVFLGLTAGAALVAAQDGAPHATRTGREIFLETCAACHAPDGKGRSRSRVGFDVPLPDFTDPDFASREANHDWAGIARNGGPSRGFSEIMPSFRDALTLDEIALAVGYIKSLHEDRSWPPGEFNLPRPLVTEKAFPEDEAVFTATAGRSPEGLDSIQGKFVYEQRFGSRNMWEVVAPFGWSERVTDPLLQSASWGSNLGDIAVAVKRAFYHNLRKGSILSASAELILPTGDRDSGYGKGTFVFEPFLAYGQILPADFFIQAQGGLEIPFKRDEAANEAFLRVAFGKSINYKGYGRLWSPMVEILAAKELVSGEKIVLDIVPQFQVTLNRRQHIRLNIGVRLPVNEPSGRNPAVMVYLLWDWFDGAFFAGW